ncbi:MAG: NAD-dependent epimerase/dehydratase family protein [Promethearchaeota archaeon]
MKALVTGSAGFSAGYVCDLLLEKGWDVVATDLPHLEARVKSQPWGGDVEFIGGDLTNKDSLKPLVDGVDVVFHPAAIFSYSAPMELLRKVNVGGTQNMIEVSMDAGVKKMVMWSSVALYGSADPKFYDMPVKELPIEELNPDCEGKYDHSKREQEAAALKYWEENKFPVSFMRCAPMYGPGSYYGMYTLFYYIKRQVLPAVFRNLHKASVPLVHARDVANAALFLSDEKNFNGEAYNVVDDNVLDMIQTLRFVGHLTNSKLKTLVPMPIKLFKPFLKLFGMWSKWEADHLRKKVNGKPKVPKLETDTILYMFGNFWFSNEKLKEAGYEFLYPDRRVALVELVNWYDEHGWNPPSR